MKSIVNGFNNYINNQDINGLASLMTENHTFIDRAGEYHGPKSYMVNGWKDFFEMFPEYRNIFERVVVFDNGAFGYYRGHRILYATCFARLRTYIEHGHLHFE